MHKTNPMRFCVVFGRCEDGGYLDMPRLGLFVAKILDPTPVWVKVEEDHHDLDWRLCTELAQSEEVM